MMSRVLLPLSLFSVASTFQIAETHEHVDYEGMKTAMVSMAKRAEKSGIDGDTVNAIRGFLNTITNTLVPALNQDKNDTQAILDAAIAAINGCNDGKDGFVADAFAQHNVDVTSARGDHETCRTEEAATFCEYKRVCQILEDRVCNWNVCTIPDFTNGDSDEVNTYMECLETFFDNHRPERSYYTDRDNCMNKTGEHLKKTAECDGLQTSFEEAFCSRETDVSDYCAEYEGCRCRKEKLWVLQEESARDLENIFQMQYVALQHLECYGEQILANESINLAACDKNNDCLSYDGCPQLVYGTPKPFIPCDEPYDNFPCEPEFRREFYGTYGGADHASAVGIAGPAPAGGLAGECMAYTPVDECTPCSNAGVTGRTWGGARKIDSATEECPA